MHRVHNIPSKLKSLKSLGYAAERGLVELETIINVLISKQALEQASFTQSVSDDLSSAIAVAVQELADGIAEDIAAIEITVMNLTQDTSPESGSYYYSDATDTLYIYSEANGAYMPH